MKLNQFIAGGFGGVGFILAIVAGLHADNPFDTVVIRALEAAIGCYIVGYCMGAIGNFIVEEHAQRIAAKVADMDAAENAKKEQAAAEATRKKNASVAGAGSPAT